MTTFMQHKTTFFRVSFPYSDFNPANSILRSAAFRLPNSAFRLITR